jgi:hypothetical protein
MKAIPPQRALLERPLPSQRYNSRWRLTVPPQRTEKGVAYVGVGERKRRRKKKKKRKGKKKEGKKIEKMNYLFLEIVIYNLY